MHLQHKLTLVEVSNPVFKVPFYLIGYHCESISHFPFLVINLTAEIFSSLRFYIFKLLMYSLWILTFNNSPEIPGKIISIA